MNGIDTCTYRKRVNNLLHLIMFPWRLIGTDNTVKRIHRQGSCIRFLIRHNQFCVHVGRVGVGNYIRMHACIKFTQTFMRPFKHFPIDGFPHVQRNFFTFIIDLSTRGNGAGTRDSESRGNS